MTIKVLVADDSQTIQKVVKITLSELSYELTQVLDEHTLIEEVETEHYDLLLLDFGLSQTVSGYDLAKSVKEKSPDTAIMAMLGTFDSINDNLMHDSGISDKITKPFESEKFIKKCQALIDGSDDEFEPQDSFGSDDDLAGGWVVDSPQVEDKKVENKFHMEEAQPSNLLNEEMKGWGVEVPGVIAKNQTEFGEFPPVIAGSNNLALLKSEDFEGEVEAAIDSSLPADDDLEYPDMGSDVDYVGSSEEDLKSVRFPGAPKEEQHVQSHVEHEEDFVAAHDQDEDEVANLLDEDATDPDYQLPAELMADNHVEEDLDVSSEEFWAADDETHEAENSSENVDVVAEVVQPIEEKVVEMEVAKQIPAQVVAPTQVVIDEDKIVERITANLKPLLESMVREYCHTNVDKVAWEVIPDLAENLIRKEIKEISKSVLDAN